MRQCFLKAIMLASTAITLACGAEGPTAPVEFTGSYSLRTIGGMPLPVQRRDADGYFRITAGQVTVTTPTSLIWSISRQALASPTDSIGGAVTALVLTGSYTRSGDSVAVTFAPADSIVSGRLVLHLSRSAVTTVEPADSAHGRPSAAVWLFRKE
jgi:hypothetical protein